MKKHLVATLLLLTSGFAVAGSGTGVITALTVQPQAGFIVLKTTTVTGSPACATWGHKFGTKINATEEFKVLSAALLAAKIAKTPVTISGTGSCVVGGYTEEISSVSISN